MRNYLNPFTTIRNPHTRTYIRKDTGMRLFDGMKKNRKCGERRLREILIFKG